MTESVDFEITTPFGEFSGELQERIRSGEISMDQVLDFQKFLKEVEAQFMDHKVVIDNEYCKWFADGQMSLDHVRHFIVQFSVFSHLFLIAQLKKMINSDSLESYRASKEILANEIGVLFNTKKNKNRTADKKGMSEEEMDRSGDPAYVSTEGSVEGGTFRFGAGHFEWLMKIGRQIGLKGFEDMGKRRFGTESTIFFCDELERIYGSDNYSIGAGASFAVENWAAAGFWKQLISGLDTFRNENKNLLPTGLSIAFFTWHDRIEEQHADHTLEELEEAFFTEGFDKKEFMHGGKEMLEGVLEFWVGLNRDRITANE